MYGYKPFQPALRRFTRAILAAFLFCILPACSSNPAEAPATDALATGIGPLGKLTGAPLPPKGQVGLEVFSWILRSGAPAVLDQLAAAGQVLPGPASTGLDGVSAGIWSASGFRIFRISIASWATIEAEIRRTPIASPVAEGQLPKLPDPNAPSGIIGPRLWMPDGADWTELARGSPLAADQVLALHDGRFRAPASTPRLLARAFSVWNMTDLLADSTATAAGTSRLIVEIVPQLLGVRKQGDDLDLINPRLATQWSRGQVLERLLGAVTVDAGQVLVITTSTAADSALFDEPPQPDDSISRPGRMRSSTAAAPPVRTGLGPPAAPDALGNGSPFIGGNRSTSPSSSANLPAEAQAVPTIAQAILAARQAPAEPDSTGRLAKASPLARSFLVLKPSLEGDTAMLPAKQNLK